MDEGSEYANETGKEHLVSPPRQTHAPTTQPGTTERQNKNRPNIDNNELKPAIIIGQSLVDISTSLVEELGDLERFNKT
jgi:hypothetical protein